MGLPLSGIIRLFKMSPSVTSIKHSQNRGCLDKCGCGTFESCLFFPLDSEEIFSPLWVTEVFQVFRITLVRMEMATTTKYIYRQFNGNNRQNIFRQFIHMSLIDNLCKFDL